MNLLFAESNLLFYNLLVFTCHFEFVHADTTYFSTTRNTTPLFSSTHGPQLNENEEEQENNTKKIEKKDSIKKHVDIGMTSHVERTLLPHLQAFRFIIHRHLISLRLTKSIVLFV